MHWSIWLFIIVGILGVFLAASGWWRYVFTGLLINRVVPYEQPGGGAGSIYVIGDSTGYGTGASQGADSVAGRLGNDYTWYTIHNNSVNGRTIAGAAEALENVEGEHDLLLLQIGANDLMTGRALEDVLTDMRDLIEVGRTKADQVVVMTAGNIGAAPMFSGEDAAYLEDVSRRYDTEMLTLAQQYQDVTFVSLFDEPVDDPFVSRSGELLADDGLHPTSAGYGIWYNKAKPTFGQLLEKR